MKKIFSIILLVILIQAGAYSQFRKITTAEFFWDNDPGQGNATALVAQDGSFNQAIESAIANNVGVPATTGNHTFNVRVKAQNGIWGPLFSVIVFVDIPFASVSNRNVKVTAAEYFWDTDPGQGSATAMLAFDGNFNQSIEQVIATYNTTNLSIGNHKLGIRIKGADNSWGQVFSTIISVENISISNRPMKVTTAEYFWDTDPGVGSATTMLAFDGNYDECIEQAITTTNTTSLNVGPHKLGVRFKGADTKWSPVYTTIVSIENTSIANRPMKITAAECFWNTDPGLGNGFPMIAFDGNFNQAIETVKKSLLTGYLSIGANVLYIRTKDVNNNWGRKFGVVVNIQTPIYPDAVIYGPTSFCSSQLSNVTYYVDSVSGYTYNWSIVGGIITTSPTKPQVNVNWNASGSYSLQVIMTNGNGSDTANITISVTTSVNPPSASSNSPQCAGSTINLMASTVNGASYLWTGPGYSSTQQNPVLTPATVSNSGYYSVVAILNGCPSVPDSVLITVNPIPSSPTVSSNSPVCEGDTIFLMASNVSNGSFDWTGPGFTSQLQNPTLIATSGAAGNYQATVTVNGCTSPNSSATNVVVNPLPTAPTLTQIGNTLHSNFLNNNQWYLNGVAINGANSNTYTPTQNGIYMVSQTNIYGCESFSAPYTFIGNDISSSSYLNFDFSVVPNPNDGSFEIMFTSPLITKTTIEVLNYLGQTVYIIQPDITGAKASVELENLSNGIYSIRIISSEKVIIHPFVISK